MIHPPAKLLLNYEVMGPDKSYASEIQKYGWTRMNKIPFPKKETRKK
jgi:hypothetical protein